ncbi:ATP dependent DNA ligase region [Opisthorchis viverrini]|uniref:ATP dependent DNA ligase region n=1 Tax=Opisthorchis viverrini TaxID=6198 RepID=A0A1S8X0M3_OPIVI|nr:ATP dependent DNA ligase region [Opisthorchis viverrini]
MADSVDLIVLGAYYGTGNKVPLFSRRKIQWDRAFGETKLVTLLASGRAYVIVGEQCSVHGDLLANFLPVTKSLAGLMSVFLMGAYDPASKQFTTVTKCGNGFTDEMLQTLQKKLKMKRITQKIMVKSRLQTHRYAIGRHH